MNSQTMSLVDTVESHSLYTHLHIGSTASPVCKAVDADMAPVAAKIILTRDEE